MSPAKAPARPRLLARAPSVESLFIATFVLLGFRLGVRPISDNSMLTHLRTGIDIARGAGIPRTDPYSFTAAGTRWVVQSWLPEWTYGLAHRLGGFRLVVLEQAVLTALVAWLLARLVRTGSPVRTALAGVVAFAMGAAFWAPRPLLFGLLCMALTITIVERRRSHWLLVPVVWLWVNSHGSFPLGLVYLGARALGEWRDWRAWPSDAVRYIGGFAAGLLAGAINPLGPRLLAFPFTLGAKRDVFARIVEWRSPDFQATGPRVALVALTIALVLLVRWRVAWRDTVPAVVFVTLGLVAARNLPLAAVVLAPIVARALRQPDLPVQAREQTPGQLRLNRLVMAAIAAAVATFALSVFTRPGLDLDAYPEEATTFAEDNGLLGRSHRVASLDFIGNYLQLRYGRSVKVFVDDRVDMYPRAVSDDYSSLLRGKRNALDVLARHDIDVVLWEQDLPLTSILAATGKWQQVFLDEDGWVVFQRVG